MSRRRKNVRMKICHEKFQWAQLQLVFYISPKIIPWTSKSCHCELNLSQWQSKCSSLAQLEFKLILCYKFLNTIEHKIWDLQRKLPLILHHLILFKYLMIQLNHQLEFKCIILISYTLQLSNINKSKSKKILSFSCFCRI